MTANRGPAACNDERHNGIRSRASIHELPRRGEAEEVARVLRELLARAEAGGLVGLAVVASTISRPQEPKFFVAGTYWEAPALAVAAASRMQHQFNVLCDAREGLL